MEGPPNSPLYSVCVLLRVTQIGLSETSVMRDYHKDALDRYNVTCDFPNVIRELIDPHKRFPFQVGAPTACIETHGVGFRGVQDNQPLTVAWVRMDAI
jgi:hypothetical protein